MQHRSLSPASSPRGGASSLLRLGIGSTTVPAPLWSPRPAVLSRQANLGQQLSLFSRRGGSR